MIISFCKKTPISELFICSFDIGKTSFDIITLLSKKGKMTVKDIASELGVDRSTVQKLIKELMDKNLVKREKINLSKGGYIYLYKILDKRSIKRSIRSILKHWYVSSLNEIKRW